MSNHTPEKATTESVFTESESTAQDTKLHRRPVARLLAKVSKLSGDYTDYQMETCTSRKLAI